MGLYKREPGEFEWRPTEVADLKEILPERTYDTKYAQYVENVLNPALKSYKPDARLLVQSEEPADRIFDKLIVDTMIMGEGHRKYI